MRRANPRVSLAMPALVAWPFAVLLVVGSLGDAFGIQRARWKDYRKDCIDVLTDPEHASEDKVRRCVDLFAWDAVLGRISSVDQDGIRDGLEALYRVGDRQVMLMARDGLYRLGVKLPVRRGGPQRVAAPAGGTALPPRKRYDPPMVPSSRTVKAEKLTRRGVKDLRRRRYDAGVRTLEEAVQADPRSEFALYNLACGYALQKNKDASITHLRHLSDLATEQSLSRLVKARQDQDFAYIRDDPAFKAVTGRLRIEVVNTIGEPGERAVDNVEQMLGKLDHKEVQRSESKDEREEPQVLFKPHAKAHVQVIADLLNHPRVRLDPMNVDSKYDVIIRWGSKVERKGGELRVESTGPEVVDSSVAEARRRQNQALARPERAINRVDYVVSTPERTYNSVESMGKRTKNTVDKARGLGNKLEKIGGKIDSL